METFRRYPALPQKQISRTRICHAVRWLSPASTYLVHRERREFGWVVRLATCHAERWSSESPTSLTTVTYVFTTVFTTTTHVFATITLFSSLPPMF
jgi:hypothetical protein